ncbi:riboflavin synthase [Gloeocapsa sp. PCC 73106]|uniref:riboflavin synthase n=1 Tax=Gloeocapsa sp. PCC 73106 TaxID=102232 RepID=UPI0002AC741F|nr:riboflavin synthase [Gloeocapsa sp. PCC 73106]ELR99489.1 riboflavin synthase alpha chain [Gloeocapsa sp. PCC 73106]
MFTGLVQSLGRIELLDQDHLQVIVESPNDPIMVSDLALGDSIAVDGVCLTVEKILSNGFVAIASPETLKRSTLGHRDQATKLTNLEASLRMGSKLGGHFVTGHVDGIGCLRESISTASSWEMTFSFPTNFSELWSVAIAPYIILKGSVAVNGISLTVADCDPERNWFKVAVIPHTYQHTNLSHLQQGDWVNIEGDILGKYVNQLLNGRYTQNSLDSAFLAEHGYL